MIYLPPYSTASGRGIYSELPLFCHGHPTAVIHYRWAGYSPFTGDGSDAVSATKNPGPATPLYWPTPLHDVLQGYSWILENLAPQLYKRRDVYIFGSYLGASLATSLALTEARPHHRMAVRGCVAFNGVYNWTMFLPDHPINRAPKSRSSTSNILEEILGRPQDPGLLDLKQHAPALFKKPDNLFDPFASPCLFFHTPGLHVPRTFTKPVDQDYAALSSPSPSSSPSSSLLPLSEFLSSQDLTPEALLSGLAQKPPRMSPLVFPPRKSTLKIPQTLLLHTTAPPPPPSLQRRRRRRTKKEAPNNSFRTQANELAGVMRRSVDKIEMKERLRWDEDYEGWEDEAVRRVQVYDVGLGEEAFGLPRLGNGLVEAWLEDRLTR